MQFSLALPTQHVDEADEFVTAEAIAEVTRHAAAAGFSAVNVTDHPAPDGKWLDHGGHHALDPFVALSFAAAADPAILLHTNIYVAGYRNPFLGAKTIQSLEVLSGGRVILGVGAGYLKPEFAALGVDFDKRGPLLDDALEVLAELSSGADVARSTPEYSARGVRFRPTPPTGRGPRVWVGGNSSAARRRATAHDGWAPFHTAGFSRASRTAAIESTEDLAIAVAEVRSEANRINPDREFDVCWSESLVSSQASVDQRCQHVATLASIGVSWMSVTLTAPSRRELLEGIDSFGRDVIRATGSLTAST